MPTWGDSADAARREIHCRHEPGSASDVQPGKLSARPLLSFERCPRTFASAKRAKRGHPDAGGILPQRVRFTAGEFGTRDLGSMYGVPSEVRLAREHTRAKECY